MPSESPKRSVLRTVFLWGMLSLVFVAATWLAVIAWWDMTEHIASWADVLPYMIGLPLGILAFVALIRWTFFAQKRRAQSPLAQPEAAPAHGSLEAIGAGDAATSHLPVLAAWATTPIASEGGDFVEKLAQRRLRPVPDQLLVDGAGFPPLTGRVQALDTDRICATLLGMHPERIPDDEIDPEEHRDSLLRALALLESVLQQAAQEWPLGAEDAQTIAQAESAQATLRGSAGLSPESDSSLKLHVKLLISTALTLPERHTAQAFAEQRLAALGICGQRQPVEVVPSADDATALNLIETFRLDAQEANRHRIPQALLILACESALCQTTVDLWEDQAQLFAPHQPNGLMPGEAAFAVLCANELAVQAAAAGSLCYLARSVCAQRSDNIDRKKAHECLSTVIRAALSASGIAADAIGTVVCDADHRTGVTLESIEAMLTEMPTMDAIEDRLAVNEMCGHLGAASITGVLAAAAIRTHAAGHPVLIFNASHASERAAAVLLPADGEDVRAQSRSLEST